MLKFLKTDKEFAAFKASKSYSTKLLRIRVRFTLNQNIPRFGFIIPKKTLPKVVDRNKIKRRIKTMLAANEKMIKGADVVFYPQKELLKVDFKTLSSEITGLFIKAHIWKRSN